MDLLNLVAKITLDSSEYENGVNKAESKGNKLATALGGIGKVAANAGKVAATSIVAAAGAIAAVTKGAVQAYASYEQNIGGVETLFKDNADTVVKYAKEAYKTAGVDANTYMENVTSFSASLLKSMKGDTQKAAEVANMAMIDMSDNANKMGTDMSAIQSAYQGFAKQNYTMLDNLKLGYGGTQKEMKRLLKDAEKIQKQQGKNVKYNINNLNDVYEAIHVIQTELGITGTTAEEASTTIQGSITQMKSAWENLKIAFVDPNGDISGALDNFISSAKTAAKNLVPAISQSLKGIGTAIKEFAPVISEELPGLFKDILPDLITGATSLVSGIATTIVENAPMIIDGFGQMFQSAGEAMEKSDNPIFSAVGKVLKFIGDMIRDPQGTLAKAWESIKSTAIAAWNGIKKKATEIWDATVKWVDEHIIQPVVEWVQKKWGNIVASFTTLKNWAAEKWEAIVSWAREKWGQITSAFATLGNWVKEKWNAAVSWTREKWGQITSAFSTLGNWVNKTWEAVVSWAREKWGQITSAFATLKNWVDYAWKTTVNFVAGSLEEIWKQIKKIPETVTTTWKIVKETVVKNVAENAAENLSNPADAITTVSNTLNNPFGTALDILFGGGKAKGDWNVPYDMVTQLHRGEMVLTKSQARKYRDGESGESAGAIAAALNEVKNTLANLKLYVGTKEFGRAVVDYSGSRMSGYLSTSTEKVAAGYGG